MNPIEKLSKIEEANNERALIYFSIYRELKSKLGVNKAINLLRTALFNHGREYGKSLKKFAPNDFKGLYDTFAFAPDGGKMFSPKKIKCNQECLGIKFMSWPLKKAWEKLNISNEDLSNLLFCASALDSGTMSEAGFNLEIKTWEPGEMGCCKLKITKR